MPSMSNKRLYITTSQPGSFCYCWVSGQSQCWLDRSIPEDVPSMAILSSSGTLHIQAFINHCRSAFLDDRLRFLWSLTVISCRSKRPHRDSLAGSYQEIDYIAEFSAEEFDNSWKIIQFSYEEEISEILLIS